MRIIVFSILLFSLSAFSVIGGKRFTGSEMPIHQISTYNMKTSPVSGVSYVGGARNLGTGFFISHNLMMTTAHTVYEFAQGEKTFFEVNRNGVINRFTKSDVDIYILPSYQDTKGGCADDVAVIKFKNFTSETKLTLSHEVNATDFLGLMGYGATRMKKGLLHSLGFSYQDKLHFGYNKLHSAYPDHFVDKEVESLEKAKVFAVEGKKEDPTFSTAYHWTGDSGSPVFQNGSVVGMACGIKYTYSETHNMSAMMNLTHPLYASFIAEVSCGDSCPIVKP